MGVNELIEAICVALIGVIAGFAGYKTFRFSVTMLGAYGGYLFGNYAYDAFGKDLGINGNMNAYWIIIGLFVIAFGSAAFALYRKAIIGITTLIVAYWFYTGYTIANPPSNAGTHVIIAAIGIVFGGIVGVAVYHISKYAIMFITAAIGGYITAGALTPIFMQIEPLKEGIMNLTGKAFDITVANSKETLVMSSFLAIVFAVAGFVVQLVNKD